MGWGRSSRPGDTRADETTVDVLATSAAFGGCDREALRRLAALGTEVKRGPGAVLVRAGGVLREAVVVLDGVVAERPALGRERAVSAGHVLGHEALIRPHAMAGAAAVAQTDVRLLVFGPEDLAEVAELARPQEPEPAPLPARSRRPVFEVAWGRQTAALA